MDAQRIKSLIDAMAASDLAEMQFSQDGWTLRLVRRADVAKTGIAGIATGAVPTPAAPGPERAGRFASPPAAPAEVVVAAPKQLAAPLYGLVHLQPSPGEPPFVSIGQAVRTGQTLCVIEAMKVFNEVRAEFDACVDAVLVVSGQEVEAGQPLLRFAPSA